MRRRTLGITGAHRRAGLLVVKGRRRHLGLGMRVLLMIRSSGCILILGARLVHRWSHSVRVLWLVNCGLGYVSKAVDMAWGARRARSARRGGAEMLGMLGMLGMLENQVRPHTPDFIARTGSRWLRCVPSWDVVGGVRGKWDAVSDGRRGGWGVVTDMLEWSLALELGWHHVHGV
jgi:hypothetical protein